MRRIFSLAVLSCGLLSGAAYADTVNVTPSNMNGWTLNSFDPNGNIVTTGPYAGTAAMVAGPATPPAGTGSAHLATPAGAGDGAAAIATESFDGTKLNTITSLSYWTYDVTNNGQQFPYLALSVDTDPGQADNQLDTLFFEPPYQQSSTGNSSLPSQEAPVQDTWQSWDALEGGWWDNYGLIGSPGTGVGSLAAFEATYSNAVIANGGYAGLGGIAMQVGFGSPGETEDGNVDAFTIGIGGSNTTFNFDPNAATPLPSSVWAGAALLGLLGVTVGTKRRKPVVN